MSAFDNQLVVYHVITTSLFIKTFIACDFVKGDTTN